MKSIDELGISPAPWDGDHYAHYVASAGEVGSRLCVASDVRSCDLNLIAAAPEMYEALREAVKSYCEGCNDFVNGDQRCNPCECPARKWRAALAKASGEVA